MRSATEACEQAQRKILVAEHMLTQTYPLVKDPKVLLGVLQNIIDGVDRGMETLLILAGKEATDTFPERLTAFKRHIAVTERIPDNFLRFIGELQEIMSEHRKSPVEFARKEQFVICDETYRVRTLNAEQLKRHLMKGKAFVAMVAERVKNK